jgi:hypothetical protein
VGDELDRFGARVAAKAAEHGRAAGFRSGEAFKLMAEL